MSTARDLRLHHQEQRIIEAALQAQRVRWLGFYFAEDGIPTSVGSKDAQDLATQFDLAVAHEAKLLLILRSEKDEDA